MRPILLILFLLISVQAQALPVERPKIVATNYPLFWIASHLAKDWADVVQLMPPGVDHHDYQPTPKEIASLYEANLIVYNSFENEPWIGRIEAELLDKDVELFEIANLRWAGGEGEERHTHESGFGHPQYDPHFWLDPGSMDRLTLDLGKYLLERYPKHQHTVEANMAELNKITNELDAAYRRSLADCYKRVIFVEHDAYRYLARRYGFKTQAIRGLSPNQRPSAKRLAELREMALEQEIEIIFYEEMVSSKYSKMIAEEVGAKVRILHPIGSLTLRQIEKGEDYVSLMKQNLWNLREALQCGRP